MSIGALLFSLPDRVLDNGALFALLGAWQDVPSECPGHGLAVHVVDTMLNGVFVCHRSGTRFRAKPGGWLWTFLGKPFWVFKPKGDTCDYVGQITRAPKAGCNAVQNF